MQSRAHPRQSYASASPYRQPPYSTQYSREDQDPRGHATGDHLRNDLTYPPTRLYAHSTPRGARPGSSYPAPTSSFIQPPSVSMHRAEVPPAPPPPPPEKIKTPRTRQKQSFTETHSFDVLRSEPGTVSLEHIASSKTLQNRSSNAPKAISPAGVANGSAPAFRVALPMSSSSERSEKSVVREEATDVPTDRHFTPSAVKAQSSVYLPAESPSIVSFSMADGSNVSKLTVDDSGSYFQEASGGGIFRVDGRGKKHQCPQCPKRFNRPSSLRIHVNTHTGARRAWNSFSSILPLLILVYIAFQCPYPNCGREFNVNSNMRRHYRNHSIAAAADVHPPRHNSGRRPRGYQRTHPSRFARTVFHSSPGTSIHLLQSAPSAASMTDDDSDMEEDLDNGEGSGLDDENEFDDTIAEDDDEDMSAVASPTQHKSVTWSPSPSPPQTRLNQDSESRAIAPPCSSPPRHLYPSSSRIGHTYMPSSPAYIQACRDSRVSTTLRPAFR